MRPFDRDPLSLDFTEEEVQGAVQEIQEASPADLAILASMCETWLTEDDMQRLGLSVAACRTIH